MPFEQVFPRSFNENAIRRFAPAISGVFGISNATQWIFIGESDNIQSTLLDLLVSASAPLHRREPTGFVFEVCDRVRRTERMGRLILEYHPDCSRL